jgi:hypothetical protein
MDPPVDCRDPGAGTVSIAPPLRHELGIGPIVDFDLAGDGRTVLLAVDPIAVPRRTVIYSVDAAGTPAEAGAIEDAWRPRLAADGAGGFGMAHSIAGDGRVAISALTAGGAHRRFATSERGELGFSSRPAWDGRTWVVAWIEAGTTAMFLGYASGGTISSGHGLGFASGDPQLAVDPATGFSYVLSRGLMLATGADDLRVFVHDRDGASITLRPIVEPEWLALPSIAVRPGGVGRIVVGGIGWDEKRLIRWNVRQYDEATLEPRGGFSAPARDFAGIHDVAAGALAGHAHAYLLAGVDGIDAERRIVLNAGGEDFVSDLRTIPGVAMDDAQRVRVAPGPCGFVVAWTDHGSITTAIVSVPPPR